MKKLSLLALLLLAACSGQAFHNKSDVTLSKDGPIQEIFVPVKQTVTIQVGWPVRLAQLSEPKGWGYRLSKDRETVYVYGTDKFHGKRTLFSFATDHEIHTVELYQ